MKKHSNKEVRAAIKYAIAQGWEFDERNGHAFGILNCPTNKGCRGGHYCTLSVWSTPKSPENHAKSIMSAINKCTSKGKTDK